MFDFKKKVLNPLISRITRDIDAARQTGNIGERIENLLSAKEAGETALEKVASRERSKASVFLDVPIILGLYLMIAPLGAPLCLVVGGFLLAVGVACALTVKKVFNVDEVEQQTRHFKNKIESEVQGLAAASPVEALKSPRFLNALKERFNLGSAVPETELSQLRLLLAPVPAATPALKEGAKP
jgi:hypothetical protein